MRICGAVLAGGQSRRFGSDKALAVVEGQRLIDRALQQLAAQTERVVLCGREEPEHLCLEDRPTAGLGPLGGLCAALAYADENGFDYVLSSPCDIPNLPPDLASQLSGAGAAIASDQPVVGLWPRALHDEALGYLEAGRRSLYGFAESVGARHVDIYPALRNINHPDDLRR